MEAGAESRCPGCGGPLPTPKFDHGVLACPACGACSVRLGGAISVVGGEAPLASPNSPIKLHRRGTVAGRPAEVVGRTQFDYGDGFFDEWTVRFEDDGTVAWLQDDEGEFVLMATRRHGHLDPPAFRVGGQVGVLGATLFVQELGEARIRAVRGESDLAWPPRRQVRYAAGLVDGASAIALFGEGEIVLALGEALDRPAIQLGVRA